MLVMPLATDHKSRPRWARAILDARTRQHGSQPKLIEAAEDALSQTKLSRLERGVAHPDTLTASEFFALLAVLNWTIADYEKLTGLTVSPLIKQLLQPLNDPYTPAMKSATVKRIGVPGKPVRNLDRAGFPILPHEEIVNRFPIAPEHDQPGLELYSYRGARLIIGSSYVQNGDIIAMVPAEPDLVNGRMYVVRHGTETFVARCTRAGRTTWFATDEPERDAITEQKVRVLGRVPRFWNQHEA